MKMMVGREQVAEGLAVLAIQVVLLEANSNITVSHMEGLGVTSPILATAGWQGIRAVGFLDKVLHLVSLGHCG